MQEGGAMAEGIGGCSWEQLLKGVEKVAKDAEMILRVLVGDRRGSVHDAVMRVYKEFRERCCAPEDESFEAYLEAHARGLIDGGQALRLEDKEALRGECLRAWNDAFVGVLEPRRESGVCAEVLGAWRTGGAGEGSHALWDAVFGPVQYCALLFDGVAVRQNESELEEGGVEGGVDVAKVSTAFDRCIAEHLGAGVPRRSWIHGVCQRRAEYWKEVSARPFRVPVRFWLLRLLAFLLFKQRMKPPWGRLARCLTKTPPQRMWAQVKDYFKYCWDEALILDEARGRCAAELDAFGRRVDRLHCEARKLLEECGRWCAVDWESGFKAAERRKSSLEAEVNECLKRLADIDSWEIERRSRGS